MQQSEPERVREARQFFRSYEDAHGIQELHLFRGSWYAYAEGYREAAEALARQGIKGTRPNFLVFPIVYLYRHYLELTLKMLIIDLDQLHGVEEPSPVGHNLGRLWKGFRERILSLPRYKHGFSRELTVIQQAVTEFTELDANAQHFRYPTTQEGTPVRHTMSAIDLKRLREEIVNLGAAFQQVEAAVGEWLDDMAHEFRAWELFEGDFT